MALRLKKETLVSLVQGESLNVVGGTGCCHPTCCGCNEGKTIKCASAKCPTKKACDNPAPKPPVDPTPEPDMN